METAAARVSSFVEGRRLDNWSIDQVASLGHEAIRRWQSVRRQFSIDLPLTQDAVAMLDAQFQLLEGEEFRIRRALPGPAGLIAIRYLKWDAFPLTRSSENPYEPLLGILEHGGSLRVEHNMFLDLIDHSGKTCGIVLARQQSADDKCEIGKG